MLRLRSSSSTSKIALCRHRNLAFQRIARGVVVEAIVTLFEDNHSTDQPLFLVERAKEEAFVCFLKVIKETLIIDEILNLVDCNTSCLIHSDKNVVKRFNLI